MLKIAITGNIASGKSQLENFLKNKGCRVFDTDDISHEILDTIKEFKGYDVFTNGKIDRKKLGNLVFSNEKLLRELESIVHPQVKSKVFEIFENYKNEKFVFISVPLLFETGFDKLFDKIILVAADKEIQLERLMNRNNLSLNEAEKRIKSQMPLEEKFARSDYVIENNSNLDEFYEKFEDLFCQLLSLV